MLEGQPLKVNDAMVTGWWRRNFQQGIAAAKDCQPSGSNPYPAGSDAAVAWLGGWRFHKGLSLNDETPQSVSTDKRLPP